MTIPEYMEEHGARPDGGPICVDAVSAIDYSDMSDYIQSWPDKLVAFVSDHLADDFMKPVIPVLLEYINEADGNGPAFEKWRATA